MPGLYAADGSINVTVVDGTTLVGSYAADGSLNVVDASASGVPSGVYHPSGALNVTPTEDPVLSIYAPNGSVYVTEDSANTGAMRITVVSGSFGGGGDDSGTPIGLLLILTYP